VFIARAYRVEVRNLKELNSPPQQKFIVDQGLDANKKACSDSEFI
jgi:hypothetical protein